MTTTQNADRVDFDWQIQAETALVAGLAYAGAVTAAAMVAAAGDRIVVVSAASVCVGALGALAGMALAAGRRTFTKITSADAFREAGLPAGAGD
jgi:hypothetical protein